MRGKGATDKGEEGRAFAVVGTTHGKAAASFRCVSHPHGRDRGAEGETPRCV